MNDLISIVVPIYRVEKYLHRCVESIIKQTYSNLEIILVDDGSDDMCPGMCDDFARIDNRIKAIHQKNAGLSAARNTGIEVANGQYIAFVDSDDCISEHYIEFLYRALKESKSDIAQCLYTEFDDNCSPTFASSYTIPRQWDKMQALRSQLVPDTNIVSTVAWNKLYKISLFKNIRYTPGKLHEDEFTTFRIFDEATHVTNIDIALYGYFQNQSGIMRSSTKSAHIDALEAKLNRYTYYLEKGYQELLPLVATDYFDTLLDLSRKMKNAVDQECYRKRLKFYLEKAKETLAPSDLNRLDRIILGIANTPEQLIRCFNAYLLGGRISKFLQVAKIKKSIMLRRMMKRYLNELRSVFANYNPGKTVFILGAVEYENLGDQAIVMAQRDFIQTCLPDYNIIEIREDLFRHARSQLRRLIKPESIITIPGGGNMGDIWFDDEERRRSVIEDYPDNTIVVFPQTIDYSNSDKGKKCLEESIKIYNSHNNLILCAREQFSFEQMKKFYPNCNIVLAPDIVLSLQLQLCQERKDVLICLRNDKEKKTSPLLLNEIKAASDTTGFEYKYTDTIASSRVLKKDRDKTVIDKLNEFASAKLVITDRLHGMIFAAITQTPCLVLPNSNHKIKGVFDLWLTECQYIQYKEELNTSHIIEMYEKANQFIEEYEFNMDKYTQLREVLINGKNETPH